MELLEHRKAKGLGLEKTYFSKTLFKSYEMDGKIDFKLQLILKMINPSD